ncbi:hypothetical protein Tco_1174427 [Tanacetum coccineum]
MIVKKSSRVKESSLSKLERVKVILFVDSTSAVYQNSWRSKPDPFGYQRPKFGVPLRYLKILFTATRYISDSIMPLNKDSLTETRDSSGPKLFGGSIGHFTEENVGSQRKFNHSIGNEMVRYCPPSKTAKQLEEIRNFKQEGDKTLYQAWEQYNDLLYRCPTHDIKALNCQLLNSQGPILGMTPVQALMAIQTMTDHS